MMAFLPEQVCVMASWPEYSAHPQMTAPSLMGDAGPEAQRTAWSPRSSGWVGLVGADSQDTGLRRLRMSDPYGSMIAKLGEDIAYLVCIENPSRVIEGLDMLSARSLASRVATEHDSVPVGT